MKKLIVVAIISLFVISLASSAWCDTAVTKLGRGLANMITFPLEIPEQIKRTNESDGPLASWTVGLLKGIGCSVGRACVGVYEAATFIIPSPKDYQPILKDPEYFLQDVSY